MALTKKNKANVDITLGTPVRRRRVRVTPNIPRGVPNNIEAMRIAGLCGVDYRTVQNYFMKKSTHYSTRALIRQALQQLQIADPNPERA